MSIRQASSLFACLCAVTLAFVLTANAQGNISAVYVSSNITTNNGNTVLGFTNDGLGNLTAIPGSPWLTGGSGVKNDGPDDRQFDGDGEVAINQAGTLLFAVNGHTNTVAVFQIHAGGILSAAAGSPFPSNGEQPASVALKDDAIATGTGLAVVVNKASDPDQNLTGTPNYTTFDYSTAGVMTMNPGSEFDLAAGGSAAQAIMWNKANNRFFGIEFMTGLISSYRISQAGILSLIQSVTPPVGIPATLGGYIHPSSPAIYVALPMAHSIVTYTYDNTGNMTFQNTIANEGGAVCWLTMNKAGTRLYSAETTTGTISVYSTRNYRHPVQLQHFSLNLLSGGVLPFPAHMGIDPTGKFLYVLDRNGVLHVVNILSDGTLSETIAPVSLGITTGDIPLGLAVLSR